jgi:hypothetical protein
MNILTDFTAVDSNIFVRQESGNLKFIIQPGAKLSGLTGEKKIFPSETPSR